MSNLETFEQKIEQSINPALTAKELAELMVIAALESEFGRSFTLSRGFAKMVSALADSIVANPDLRRQTLAVASTYLNKKT